MKAMPWLIALGIVLPTMHQSSLGSMILLAGPKLHPLWLTGWLPFFFLISCIANGIRNGGAGDHVVADGVLALRGNVDPDGAVARHGRGPARVGGRSAAHHLAAGKIGYVLASWTGSHPVLAGDPAVLRTGHHPDEQADAYGQGPDGCSGRPDDGDRRMLHRFTAYWFAFQPGRSLELLPGRTGDRRSPSVS